MGRIERLTSAARTKPAAATALEEPGSVREALDHLSSRPRIRGNAA
jgi:hypothetical protein